MRAKTKRRGRRSMLAPVLAILALIVAACGGEGADTGATGAGTPTGAADQPADQGTAGDCESLDSITFRLNWVQNYNQVPITVAKDKGWYEDECLDVAIEGGQGSADTTQIVGTGAAEMGIADAVAVIQGQEKGLPVTGVGAMWRNNAFAVLIRGDAIETDDPAPEDLYGLTFGAVTTGSPYIFWQAFVNQQNIDSSQIEQVSISAPGFAEFVQGSVDFIANFRGAKFILEAQGAEVVLLQAADYGQIGYGLSIIANSDWLEQESSGDIVTRFLRASARGMVWSGNNPEEAIEILGKYATDVEGELKPFQDSIKLWSDQGVNAPEEFFRFDAEGVEGTQQLLYDAGLLEGEPMPIMEHWTDQYLPDPSTYTNVGTG